MDILEVGHHDFKKINDLFYLHWSVTNLCNYQCDYCGVYKTENLVNKDKWQQIVKYINFISNNHTMETVLFGGESSIHPDIIEIVNSINSNIIFLTNLSMELGFYKELVKTKNYLKVVPSYHHLKADKKKFLIIVKYLLDYVPFLKIKVMWDSRCKNDILNVYHEFKKLETYHTNFKCSLDLVYNDDCGGDWNDNDLTYFDRIQNDNSHAIVIKNDDGTITTKRMGYNSIRRLSGGFPEHYSYTCSCGRNGLFIESNGDVFYCQTMKNEGKPIFNLFNADYNDYLDMFNKDIICRAKGFCCEVVVPRRRLPNKIRERLK